MEMIIIYGIIIVLILGIVWHIFCHLMVIFHKSTTDLYLKKVMENPYKYVIDEEMCYVIRNMVYFLFITLLLVAACKGNMKYEKTTKRVEISNVKDK